MVRGEEHRQENLQRFAGPVRRWGYLVPIDVVIVREQGNPYDPNAIRVEIQGLLVGYIAKEIAAALSPALAREHCQSLNLAGIIRGGAPNAPSLGVHLWPGRKLSAAGPELRIKGMQDCSWPPYDGEGSE